jgi:hypothetical protein
MARRNVTNDFRDPQGSAYESNDIYGFHPHGRSRTMVITRSVSSSSKSGKLATMAMEDNMPTMLATARDAGWRGVDLDRDLKTCS